MYPDLRRAVPGGALVADRLRWSAGRLWPHTELDRRQDFRVVTVTTRKFSHGAEASASSGKFGAVTVTARKVNRW